MRRAHFIKPNHASQSPQAFIAFDTESVQRPYKERGLEHQLSFGWACYVRRIRGGKWSKGEYFRFETGRELWEWVSGKARSKVKLLTFCHNTSFDLPITYLLQTMPELGWELKSACIDAPPTIMEYVKDSKKIRILDSLNIWRMPLAAIGEQIGLEKLDIPDEWGDRERDDAYCRRDVDIIVEAVKGWLDMLKREDMGGFAPTLAGQSVRSYRHRGLEHDILIDDNPRALALSREAYRGGRNEALYIGKANGDFYLLDINSHYPYVMLTHEYPTVLQGHYKHIDVDDLWKWTETKSVCARVVLNTDKPAYGIHSEGKLIFPVGRFEAVLSTPELRYALLNGHIESTSEAAVYARAPLFRKFVRWLYNRRLEARKAGDDVLAWQLKILLNSLYGKFGQRGIVWDAYEQTEDLSASTWTEIDAETGDTVKWRQLGGLVQQQVREMEARESHPAIAAHVTGYGRMLLWQFMEIVGNGHLYYVDTDSLLCDRVGRDRLDSHIDADRLGALKLERHIQEIEIYGCKDYVFGHVWKTKGVRKNAIFTSPDTIEQAKWSSLRGMVSGRYRDLPVTAVISKQLRRQYVKGTLSDDGWVSPLLLQA